jgi:hypothetical protein
MGRDISAYRTNVLDKESIMTDDLQLGPLIYLDACHFSWWYLPVLKIYLTWKCCWKFPSSSTLNVCFENPPNPQTVCGIRWVHCQRMLPAVNWWPSPWMDRTLWIPLSLSCMGCVLSAAERTVVFGCVYLVVEGALELGCLVTHYGPA